VLQKESKIITADNTGAKVFKCIHVANKKKYGSIGDLLNVVIKQFKINKGLQKKTIYYGLIIILKVPIYRHSGVYLKSDSNRIVVLNKETLKFLGTRIQSPLYKEMYSFYKGKKKLLRFEKIVSLAKKII
jgi:large subunit ribosomal protein L14